MTGVMAGVIIAEAFSGLGRKDRQEINGRGWREGDSRWKEYPDQHKVVSELWVWSGNRSRWYGRRGSSWGELSSKAQAGVAWGALEAELVRGSTKARRLHVTCFILSA